MAGATTVWLRPGPAPVFDGRCVACDGDPQGQVQRCTGRWGLGLRTAVAEVPMCGRCAVAWRQRWHERFWTELVALSLAVLTVSVLLPSFGGHRAEDWWLRAGGFLLLMLPAWAGLLHLPLSFALVVRPERVGYAFARADLAARFAQANAPWSASPAVGPWPARRRSAVLAALFVTIALGLLSRRFPLPGLLAEHTGDALYASAAFWLFAWLRPAAGSQSLAMLAAAFAAAVEFSQLLTWPWLGALRANPFGALLLGQGFQAADLFAYAGGAVLACVADVTFLARSTRPPDRPDRLPHRS